MKNKFFYLFGFFFVLLSFQNCGKHEFGTFESSTPLNSQSTPNNPSNQENSNLDIPNGGSSSTPLPTPQITFSKTYNGTSVNQFLLSETIYGKVTGLGQNNVMGCAESVQQGGCQDPSRWVLLPNNDWSYSTIDKTWRFNRVYNDVGAGSFRLHFRDDSLNRSISAVVTLTP